MGLLDDAIREHLDLKRRRGAEPADVERDERDALGPVRRVPESAAEQAERPPGLDTEQESAYDQAGEPGWDAEPSSEGAALEEEPAADEHEPAAPQVSDHTVRPDQPDDEPASDGPEPASEHLDLARDESEAAGHEPHRPPEQTPPAAPPRSARDAADGTTVEYDVERALGNEEGDEDVLEETPEFLQDTPDHDRLWFEQRPPRDFDFDG